MVRVQGLTKTFKDRKRGEVHAVDHVSFDVASGEIFGLLGPNGAGKTTTLRLISTLLKASSGTVNRRRLRHWVRPGKGSGNRSDLLGGMPSLELTPALCLIPIFEVSCWATSRGPRSA
jgi:ABC-type glutathione transport system ATPase component